MISTGQKFEISFISFPGKFPEKFYPPPPATVTGPGFIAGPRGDPSRPISSSHESSTRKNRNALDRE
jgi:hypothetical protein